MTSDQIKNLRNFCTADDVQIAADESYVRTLSIKSQFKQKTWYNRLEDIKQHIQTQVKLLTPSDCIECTIKKIVLPCTLYTFTNSQSIVQEYYPLATVTSRRYHKAYLTREALDPQTGEKSSIHPSLCQRGLRLFQKFNTSIARVLD